MRRPLLALAVALVLAGCGGGETVTPTPETVEGTVPAGTTTQQTTVAKGNPEAGRQVFLSAQPACGTCHTFQAAGTTGTTGPNLDESLQGKDAAFILESIVDPNAQITTGFQPGVMPDVYADQLSEQQLADLVAFLQPKS
jgi:mono/diheme cytochrome c family protein